MSEHDKWLTGMAALPHGQERFRNERHAAYEAGRFDAIEECARVAEDWFTIAPKYRTKARLAAAIRALKDKQ